MRGVLAVFSAEHKARSQGALSGIALTCGLLFFAGWVNRTDPLSQWLTWTHLRALSLGLLFCSSSFAIGWTTVAVTKTVGPLSERITFAAAAGTLVYSSGVFVVGLFGGLNRIFFVAWPVLLLAMGLPRAWRDTRRIGKRLRRFGFSLLAPRSLLEGVAAALIVVSLVALYILVLTPENAGYDARWYHLAVAERYSVTHRISPFVEGWYLGTYPQLATWLYTWAFLAPGTMFHHVQLAAHVEWFLFLATLPGIAAVTRRLLKGARVPFAAAVVFLFPGIFLYDSSLIVGADHPLAFWAPAIALALFRVSKRWSHSNLIWLAAATSGALLTKYQAVYFLAPVLIATSVFAVKRREFVPLVTFAVSGLAFTTPHWLKNAISYGNPIYPLLGDFFPSRPFHPGAYEIMRQIYVMPMWVLTGTPFERAQATLGALFTFSFIPHDWAMFHGDRPVFGSLFTLLTPMLLFLRRVRPVWMMVLACYLGVGIWFATSHQDRFLQGLLPWFAAATAALVVATWRQLPMVRPFLVALILFQVAYGSDVYFLRSHAMAGDAPLKVFASRVGDGYLGRGDARFEFGGRLAEVGRSISGPAKILVHDMNLTFGLAHEVVQDEIGWQGLFDYTAAKSPGDILETWKTAGTTHALYMPDRSHQNPRSLAREAAFQVALNYAGDDEKNFGEFRLTALNLDRAFMRTGIQLPIQIAWVGCDSDPPLGIYTPGGLLESQPTAKWSADALATDAASTLALVDAVIYRPSCASSVPAKGAVEHGFKQAVAAGGVTLYLRRVPR